MAFSCAPAARAHSSKTNASRKVRGNLSVSIHPQPARFLQRHGPHPGRPFSRKHGCQALARPFDFGLRDVLFFCFGIKKDPPAVSRFSTRGIQGDTRRSFRHFDPGPARGLCRASDLFLARGVPASALCQGRSDSLRPRRESLSASIFESLQGLRP